MRPYVAGQTVLVRFFRKGKKIHEQTEQLKPIEGGRVGMFRTPFRAKGKGRITIAAVHLKTPQMLTVRAPKVKVFVIRPVPGNGGTVVRLLQKGLGKLRYVTSHNGIYDAATQRAVMAWRKVRGMARTYSADEAVVRGVLAGKGAFKVRYPRHGRHVEADLSKQVLALIDGDRVAADLPRVLGQAVDADGARQLQGLPQVPGHELARDGALELLHRRLRDPRLRGRAALRGQPRLPARADPERVVDLQLGADGRHRRRLPVGDRPAS